MNGAREGKQNLGRERCKSCSREVIEPQLGGRGPSRALKLRSSCSSFCRGRGGGERQHQCKREKINKLEMCGAKGARAA